MKNSVVLTMKRSQAFGTHSIGVGVVDITGVLNSAAAVRRRPVIVWQCNNGSAREREIKNCPGLVSAVTMNNKSKTDPLLYCQLDTKRT